MGRKDGRANVALSYKTKHRFTIWSSNHAPWYLFKWKDNLCPHKNLHINVLKSSSTHNTHRYSFWTNVNAFSIWKNTNKMTDKNLKYKQYYLKHIFFIARGIKQEGSTLSISGLAKIRNYQIFLNRWMDEQTAVCAQWNIIQQ